ncbi:MAG: hypothetical protein Q8Q39_04565 [bacterium]|nr:hypothetical protein [bacterium]
MRIAIPRFTQPDNTPHCGPTCARMILAYYGMHYPLGRITRFFLMTRQGIDIASLGIFFLRQGYRATLMIWNSEFPNRFFGARTPIAYADIAAWGRRTVGKKGDDHRIYRVTLPWFAREGGRIITQPVSTKAMENALLRRQPFILNLNVAQLWQMPREKHAGHYVVPCAITQTRMAVNDPATGGIVRLPLEQVLHACYTWDAAALFVDPPARLNRCRTAVKP